MFVIGNSDCFVVPPRNDRYADLDKLSYPNVLAEEIAENVESALAFFQRKF